MNDQTAMPELLPCPFCRSASVFEIRDDNLNSEIGCEDCGARVGNNDGKGVERWNRRALSQQSEPVAEVISWTSGSYHRNYKLNWLRDVEEGAKLYAHPCASKDAIQRSALTEFIDKFCCGDTKLIACAEAAFYAFNKALAAAPASPAQAPASVGDEREAFKAWHLKEFRTPAPDLTDDKYFQDPAWMAWSYRAALSTPTHQVDLEVDPTVTNPMAKWPFKKVAQQVEAAPPEYFSLSALEKLRTALSRMGVAAPESLEELSATLEQNVLALCRAVDRRAEAAQAPVNQENEAAQQKGGES